MDNNTQKQLVIRLETGSKDFIGFYIDMKTTNGFICSTHKINGPASIYDNGDKEWWINNGLHRVIKPAAIHFTGDKEWWIDDKLIEMTRYE